MALMTRYNYKPTPPEEGGGESLVESAGYIPADIRIQELIMAGERLGEYRREAYDFGPDDEIGDIDVDPTRSPNFSLEDGSVLERELNGRLASQEREAMARKKSEATPPKDDNPPAPAVPPPDGN